MHDNYPCGKMKQQEFSSKEESCRIFMANYPQNEGRGIRTGTILLLPKGEKSPSVIGLVQERFLLMKLVKQLVDENHMP